MQPQSSPRLTVMLLTYNRLQYAERTLRSTLSNIKYDGPMDVHIADDGSPEGYVDELIKIAQSYDMDVTTSNSERRGYGASYNLGTQIVHSRSDIVLPVEDDWSLEKPLEISKYLLALDAGAGCIRLGYLSFTQELRSRFRKTPDGVVWLEFYNESKEPHIFAGHPRLETVGWEKFVGEWPEKLEPGYTEMAVANKPNARRGVWWPMEYIKPSGDMFVHIGTIRSY